MAQSRLPKVPKPRSDRSNGPTFPPVTIRSPAPGTPVDPPDPDPEPPEPAPVGGDEDWGGTPPPDPGSEPVEADGPSEADGSVLPIGVG